MKAEIVIIGAGAAGLMSARELVKKNKKVLILEARNRIGGRIWSLPEKDFGYEAQGGAEFTHGPVPVTKTLVREAGLTYLPMPDDGQMWIFDGELKKGFLITEHPEFLRHKNKINEILKKLNKDMPVAVFLEKFFADDQYKEFRKLVIQMVESFDAADPNKISTFSLREEWLGKEEWIQGRIKEGYGAILNFLESECKKYNVEILFNKIVNKIELTDIINIQCVDGSSYEAEKVIITVPTPAIKQIQFQPSIPDKLKAAEEIGFGPVIKVLFKFRDRWWLEDGRKNMSKAVFILCVNGKYNAWWTQYPETYPVLTGWIAGSNALELKDKNQNEIIELGIDSLAEVFSVDRVLIKDNLLASRVINWPIDPFSQGAYSYSTTNSERAYAELRKSIDNKIFFAGEALYNELETATVEGALASGLEIANKI